MVQLEIGENLDCLVWGRRPDDAEAWEMEGEEDEFGLNVKVGPGVALFVGRFFFAS